MIMHESSFKKFIEIVNSEIISQKVDGYKDVNVFREISHFYNENLII